MSDKHPGETGESGESVVPDDVWERFARDSERDIRTSAPKEPSARARMVAERLRQQDAREARQGSRWGNRRGNRQSAQPEGWRAGPSSHERDGRTARRRRIWAIIGVPLALAVAVVAMKPSLLPGDPFGTSSDGPGAASALPAETAAPSAPPSSVAPETPTLDRPFAGSPAARWADGAAGIAVPKATAVGSVSRAQVADALRQTKALLVDANLNPATLRGQNPEAALATLDPKQPEMLDELKSRLRAPGKKHDPLSFFSRFDPNEVRVVGEVVKARGRMTFKAGKNASVAIHADYTFVYPVTPADNHSTEVTRTIARRVLDVEVVDAQTYRATPGKLWVLKYDEDFGNSACDVYDGFLHPRFPSDAPAGAPPTGPTTDPYDRSRDIEHSATDTCGTVSRT